MVARPFNLGTLVRMNSLFTNSRAYNRSSAHRSNIALAQVIFIIISSNLMRISVCVVTYCFKAHRSDGNLGKIGPLLCCCCCCCIDAAPILLKAVLLLPLRCNRPVTPINGLSGPPASPAPPRSRCAEVGGGGCMVSRNRCSISRFAGAAAVGG